MNHSMSNVTLSVNQKVTELLPQGLTFFLGGPGETIFQEDPLKMITVIKHMFNTIFILTKACLLFLKPNTHTFHGDKNIFHLELFENHVCFQNYLFKKGFFR